jgi:hypothetical protein
MKAAASDWRLWGSIALGITFIFVLPPSIESLFNDSYLFGIVSVGIRGVLGVVLGVCGYLLLFGTPTLR